MTDPVSRRSFLKRLSPPWKDPDAEEDRAERMMAADDEDGDDQNETEPLE